MDSAKGEILRKSIHFHRVVQMKQPYTLTAPSFYAQYIFMAVSQAMSFFDI